MRPSTIATPFSGGMCKIVCSPLMDAQGSHQKRYALSMEQRPIDEKQKSML